MAAHPPRRSPAALLVALAIGGCVLDPVALDELECPCATGWVCDEIRNVCVESARPDGDAGTDARVPAVDAAMDAGAPDVGAPPDSGPTDSGAADEGVDAFSPWTPIADGASLRVDLGTMMTAGWPMIDSADGMVGPVDTVDGDPTDVTFTTADFNGTQDMGVASNDFGWPVTASQDSLWLGSFDGHDAALASRGTLTLGQLPPGRYEVVLFASRTGNDEGIGRLTRYTVDGMQQDLEVSDNSSSRITFSGVSPDAAGDLEIAVEVSPDGTGRFAYLGLAIVTREGP